MATPYCTAQDVIDCCTWPRFGQVAATAQARLIDAASKKVDKHCRRPYGFGEQSVVELLDGRNLPTLWLSLRPVRIVSAILINGDPLDNTYGTSWCIDGRTGKLSRGNGQDDTRFQPWFPAGIRNITVTYWGGYQYLPDDVVMGTAWLVRWLYEHGKVSGIFESESIGDYEYKLAAAALSMTMPTHVAALLADYVQDDAF